LMLTERLPFGGRPAVACTPQLRRFRRCVRGLAGPSPRRQMAGSTRFGPASLAEMEIVSKAEELPKPPTLLIGTHDGSFHCDEVCAVALLKMLAAYERAVVVRTRDDSLLEKCDIVVDVGAVYEPGRHRYDHHQRGFDSAMTEIGHKTKLSSFGLIYRHFGRDLIDRVASSIPISSGVQAEAAVDLDAIYRRVYKNFVEHIDGIDNGIEAFDGGARNYEVSTTLSGRVGALNASWNEPSSPENTNARFAMAVDLAAGEMAGFVQRCIRHWWPARALVKAALATAAEVHPSRQIVVLSQYCPWDSQLFELEAEMAKAGDSAAIGAAKYIVFNDSKGDSWRIQAVPVEEQSFTSRQAFPESWRGLRDEKLSEHIGIKDCVFVHAGGFIGGHANREGALAMARKAIGA